MKFVKVKDSRINADKILYYYWHECNDGYGEQDTRQELVIGFGDDDIHIKGPKTLLGQLEKQLENL
jgi:hypothetical protein